VNCANCGKPIAGEVNFCPYCGRQVDRGSASTDTAAWEYCQIQAYWETALFSYRCGYWADSVGRNGTYSVGWSKQYNVRGNPPGGTGQKEGELARNIHFELVNYLVGDGWEATPDRGESWWMLRFRRKECYPDFSMGQADSRDSSAFDGEWFTGWPSAAGCGLLIRGNQGTSTTAWQWSGRTFKKGAPILQLKGVAGFRFIGEEVAADGSRRQVTGVLQGDVLYVRAPGSISSYHRRA
jgi:hypothetical protein